MKAKQRRALCLSMLAGLLCLWSPVAAAQESTAIPPSNALDRIIAAGVVRIAVPRDLPPFGSLDAKGEPQGYDVDVARLIAQDLGVRLRLVPMTSVDRIPKLMSGSVDLVVANLGVDPERAKAIAFSSPYAPFFSGVFGAPGLAVKGPADLAGRKVAVTRDTLEDRELARIAPRGVEILRFDDNQATLSAFQSGQAELVVTGSAVVAAMARGQGRRIETKFILRESPASIGVRRGEPELLHWVNVFVLHKKLGGELDRLSRKWFGEPLRPLPSL
ncbi:transporter substrate-binding domain-containing protein [Ramlibacter sp. 2FC]|uniref:transporter substrate-binding domain-containing protein n=1 Tax=Ramlibacter sp. 2FC TaxID=2502188 RepID=UPI001BB265BD|nr:transporter substrate-binding domain-containing protein [Ramlibacter sp. 2FC]